MKDALETLGYIALALIAVAAVCVAWAALMVYVGKLVGN